MKKVLYLSVLLCIIAVSCNNIEKSYKDAYNSINTSDLAQYVEDLSSDKFQGRAPFTEGEKLTVNYLANNLEKLGLEPAFDESYFQEVKMLELQSKIARQINISTPEKTFSLSTPKNLAILSPRAEENILIEASELVFAGFGISAPEYSWNDYENLDVKGKTVVVLVNDPGLYTENADLFKGREMTYYGRWTYKYEEAARRGAEGVLIVHETLGAGYPYGIPRNSCMTPNLYMDDGTGNADMCAFTGWIESSTAKDIFSELGYDINKLRMDACDPAFTGFDMQSKISLEINNTLKYSKSTNVAGLLRGTKVPDEVIIYSGHWDHFGVGEKQNGDSIYNGAVDNGTTMAMLFEIAEAYTKLETRPDRSVMIFFPTAEEAGLLGSKYYAENPAFALENTIANINNDLVLPIGRMKDVMVTGFGQSDLDDLLSEAAAIQDRYLFPDPNPHTGMYFRSDHFSFASKGVPSLFARGNCDSREYGKEWAAEQEDEYIRLRYHKAADNYDPATWNFEGIVEDAQLMFDVGYRLAFSDLRPEWKEGSEFKALRK